MMVPPSHIPLPSNYDDFIVCNLPATCPEIAEKMKRVFAYRGSNPNHWRTVVNRHMNSLKKYGIVKWEGKIRNGAKLWERN